MNEYDKNVYIYISINMYLHISYLCINALNYSYFFLNLFKEHVYVFHEGL